MKKKAVFTTLAILLFSSSVLAHFIVGIGRFSVTLEKNNVVINIVTYFPHDDHGLNLIYLAGKYGILTAEFLNRKFHVSKISSKDKTIHYFNLGIELNNAEYSFYFEGINKEFYEPFKISLPTDEQACSSAIVNKIQQLFPQTRHDSV